MLFNWCSIVYKCIWIALGEQTMIVINIALVILGILYGVGSVTNFKEWYYRHDYLAIALSVFTSILLVVAGILNILN